MTKPEDLVRAAEDGVKGVSERYSGAALWVFVIAAWVLAFFVLCGGE